MKQNRLAAYFSFTRKERRAVMILLAIILIVFLLPYFIPPKTTGIDKNMIVRMDEALNHKKEQASNSDPGYVSYHERRNEGKEHDQPFNTGTGKKNLFFFDPNKLAREKWLLLGVREKTIETIQRFLSKGGQFREPNDIHKIYGLPQKLADNLQPYVRITAEDLPRLSANKKEERSFAIYSHPPREVVRFDINTADSAAFESLPGIGPALATRILRFRDKLGGFYAVRQVAETYGLPDSTFQKIEGRLYIGTSAVSKLNVNKASAKELSAHPYLGRKIAEAIIQYRNQHGPFNTPDDLTHIDLITPEVWEKIKPYLLTDQ